MRKIVRTWAGQLKTMLLRKRMRYLTKLAWRKWHRRVFKLHPEYKRPAPKAVEKEHLKLRRHVVGRCVVVASSIFERRGTHIGEGWLPRYFLGFCRG